MISENFLMFAFATILCVFYILFSKHKLDPVFTNSLSKKEKQTNLRNNLGAVFLVFIVCYVVSAFVTHLTVIGGKKIFKVEKLGHVFVAENFEATYSCKYSYSEDHENVKYGKCYFEWWTPSSNDDCAIDIEKIDNIKIEESCLWGTNQWWKCYTKSDKEIWVYILDDKLSR